MLPSMWSSNASIALATSLVSRLVVASASCVAVASAMSGIATSMVALARSPHATIVNDTSARVATRIRCESVEVTVPPIAATLARR
jgi:hypothetical protein